MAFGKLDQAHSNQPVADINMTPLIDVMLVLLVIFIITAPLLASNIKVELPKADAGPAQGDPQALVVTIRPNGSLYLKDDAIAPAVLAERFAASAKKDPTTELHIRADASVPYGEVARLMASAQKSGLSRIGFITDPTPDKPAAK
jgi:biopolymer transport protein ExbD